MNLQQFLTQSLTKPITADAITFQYENINFHVYGVLHGITGGTNKEYVRFINDTIASSKGLKLGEKSMLKMYKGLDGELDDWIQMTNKDTFKLTLRLFTSPSAIIDILKTILKEKTTQHDKFNINDRKISDIGGSTYFHLLDPMLRREYMGFPDPLTYFQENYNRRNNHGQIKNIQFADKDWSWLSYIEKYVNIPYRSIHMIENAVMEAKSKNINEVSIFIGEIHNTDIYWYVNRGLLSPVLEEEIAKIKTAVTNTNRIYKKCMYLCATALAALIPVSLIFILLAILKI